MPIIYFGLFLRVLIAFWNGFFGHSIGAKFDALKFHETAVDYSNNLVLDEFQIGWIYSFFLGIFYFLTTDSIFLGSLLSCFVWLLSAIILDKIIRMLEFNDLNRQLALLFYILLPSSLAFTSVTLREPYQLLFVNLAIYSLLFIFLKKQTSYLSILLFGVVGMGLLHRGLLVFGFILMVVGIFFILISNIKSFFWYKIIIIPVLIVPVYFSFDWLANYIGYKFNDGFDGLINIIQGHQFGLSVEFGRTTYIEPGSICQFQGLSHKACSYAGYSTFKIEGLKGLLAFIPNSLFKYLFEPMPWRISKFPDLILFLENLFRGLFIFMAFINLFFRRGLEARLFLFLFCTFFLLETIWALGTANWGQAARHHIPGLGLLVIIAFRAKLLNVKAI